MLSIDRCKEILGGNTPDSEAEKLREVLYSMVNSILDKEFNFYTEEQYDNS